MSSTDTRKRVRVVSGHYPDRPHVPVVLVDGEPLLGVTRFAIDHDYERGVPLVQITLVGIDVDLDIDGDPEYLVKVVGPRPCRESGEPAQADFASYCPHCSTGDPGEDYCGACGEAL